MGETEHRIMQNTHLISASKADCSKKEWSFSTWNFERLMGNRPSANYEEKICQAGQVEFASKTNEACLQTSVHIEGTQQP